MSYINFLMPASENRCPPTIALQISQVMKFIRRLFFIAGSAPKQKFLAIALSARAPCPRPYRPARPRWEVLSLEARCFPASVIVSVTVYAFVVEPSGIVVSFLVHLGDVNLVSLVVASSSRKPPNPYSARSSAQIDCRPYMG